VPLLNGNYYFSDQMMSLRYCSYIWKSRFFIFTIPPPYLLKKNSTQIYIKLAIKDLNTRLFLFLVILQENSSVRVVLILL